MSKTNRRWDEPGGPDGGRPSVGGALSEVVGLPTLYARWLSVRGPVALIAMSLGVTLGLIWRWPGGIAAAILGAVLGADVLLRRSGVLESPMSAVLLDTTLMSLAIISIRAPGPVVAMPFTYLVATTFLLMPWRRALWMVGYQIAWMSFLLIGPSAGLWEPLEGSPALITAVVMGVLFVFATVGVFSHAGQALADVRRSLTRRYLYEQAVAECSRALLQADDDEALQKALQILLAGTGAMSVFVERNVEHPELGLCTTLIAEAIRPGVDLDPDDHWSLVPWSKMPRAFNALSQGDFISFSFDELEGEERELYEDSEVESELDIPINIAGDWVGLIGFNDLEIDVSRRRDDVQLLTAAAEMIAWYWERRQAKESLLAAVTVLDRRLHYEEALAECSRALLMSESDEAVDAAIQALLEATGADAVSVDLNFEDPVHGPSAQVTHRVVREGSPQPDESDAWNGGPYSDFPTCYEALSKGRPSIVHTGDLRGKERERYQRELVESELIIPVLSQGTWKGSIAFTSNSGVRQWDDQDIALLQTAAEMIGMFWERSENREELESAFRRLDHRFNLERALARAARSLLSDDENPIQTTLQELLEATGADFVFVDENYMDPELGLCTRITHWAEDRDSQPTDAPQEWWSGAYADLPSSYSLLVEGRPSIIYTSQLEGAERKLYEDDGLLSELCIPISVDGEWRGSIAFSDYQIERRWRQVDIQFLQTAAELIGAYWGRQDARRQLEAVVQTLDTRARYEEALARCSQVLLADDPHALEVAFEHLRSGTQSDYIWLEQNYEDPDAGYSARIVTELEPQSTTQKLKSNPWEGGPHSATPTSFNHLSRGEPSIIYPLDLAPGPERDLYLGDGLKTELMLPVLVFGEWWGSIGFADYSEERDWQLSDIQLLRTSAELIGSYLERQQTQTRLQELIRSKDEFIASVSHELRTPLTSVLGFTEVLTGDDAVPASEREELLDLINREAQEVAWIVEDLLAFARADIGTLATNVTDMSVVDQTRAVLAGQPQDLADRVTVFGGDQRALADPGRVRQIVRNLLTNAFRYGGPEVLVRVGREDDLICTCVVDNGDGIPEEQREMVFEAYHSAHEDGGQPGSVGLGLNVSRKLARLMGGDLTYSYEEGHSVFRLSLPLAAEDVELAG